VHLPADALRDGRRADEPGVALREPLDVLRREVVVVPVGDEDEVGGRSVLGDAIGVDLDRGAPDDDPERRVAEPFEGVEKHRRRRLGRRERGASAGERRIEGGPLSVLGLYDE